MKAEQYGEVKDQIAGWPVKISSYKLGSTYYVTIDNVSPGAWLCKTEGATLEEAEKAARAKAAEMLGRTRRTAVPGTVPVPGTGV